MDAASRPPRWKAVMDPNESQQQRVSVVAQEMGAALREEVRSRGEKVRVAERNEGRRHVWRFRSGAGQGDRFLHVAHRAMAGGERPAERLLGQLSRAGWLDRLFEGSDTSFMLSPRGRLQPWPKR